MQRRDFLRIGGLTALSIPFLAPRRLLANLSSPEALAALIPIEKNLSADWVRSLTERGAPETYSTPRELAHIGMPVGGLFCGTVYLGGDGKLWLWDIFNDNREGVLPQPRTYKGGPIRPRDGAHYVVPIDNQPTTFAEGFAIRIDRAAPRTFDRHGWRDITFTNTYPVGTIDYADPATPLTARLEAFSPFIPLNTDDSSLPCTLQRFTLRNTGAKPLAIEIGGWMENAVCATSFKTITGMRTNTVIRGDSHTAIQSTLTPADFAATPGQREEIIFEDFERENYDSWIVEGTAFGDRPLDNARVPTYQGRMGSIGMSGSRAVISQNARNGEDYTAAEAHTGRLLSRAFTIKRNYITFLIGGGKKPGKIAVNLLIDGKVERTATGHDAFKMRHEAFDVRELQGREARIEILDAEAGSWGNINVDRIAFSDTPDQTAVPATRRVDFGTMSLALLGHADATARSALDLTNNKTPADALFTSQSTASEVRDFTALPAPGPIAGLAHSLTLAPGAEITLTFALAWHFPNIGFGARGDETGRHYAARFRNAAEVTAYLSANHERLARTTFLWRDTWQDSTLPHWFLNRTFANTSTLATTTCHRFATGRFYAWEGIGSCEGTCTHVWQYAQAPARLFPDIERHTREHVDLGAGFHADTGQIAMRAEHNMGPAVDGQCGRIIGVWREHCVSADDAFLRRVWPRAKKATEFILAHDTDADGILDGPQENTLDAAWYGRIAWISIQSLAALAAGREMALAMDDTEFADRCAERMASGRKNIEADLFNGDWFIHKRSAENADKFGTYNGCFIDQLWGQSFAHQAALGDIIDPDKARIALRSIWRNNFAPDLTRFLENTKPSGRPYALPGEGGTVMCTNALREENPYRGASWTAGYLSECMTGFEHQLASHMIHAGMIEEGLAMTRAIHDRYAATKRNPFNEIECSDHYARAMASYGTYLALCGYAYNGPLGHLTFAPRLTPENFKAAFTTAEGWGSFAQKKSGGKTTITLALRYGRLHLTRLRLDAKDATRAHVAHSVQKNAITAALASDATGVTLQLTKPLTLLAGQTLTITLNA